MVGNWDKILPNWATDRNQTPNSRLLLPVIDSNMLIVAKNIHLSPIKMGITTKLTRSNRLIYLSIAFIAVTIVAYNYYIVKELDVTV